MERIGIVPELAYLVYEKLLQTRSGGRVGLGFEPIVQESNILPRDELVHGVPPTNNRRP
jgi:hypothetical protein